MDSFKGEISISDIEYEPISVKDLLVQMKNTAELMIDLSYTSVLYQNEELANEVLRLEERMDILELRAQMSLLMAARNPTDAEQLAPVLGIVAATDQISDAAGDIAKVVLEDVRLPEAMRSSLPEALELLVKGVVTSDSTYANQALDSIDLESQTGVRVIAIRRENEWILNPGPQTRIGVDDVVFLRGPRPTIDEVYEKLTGEAYTSPVSEQPQIDDLERAVDTIVHMKNLSELSVDLAYSSVLFDDKDLAQEVRNLEVEVDALESRLEAWVLQAASDANDPVSLRGLIHLSTSTEVISDAAIDISEGVLRDITTHPVVRLAVQESDEVITRIQVDAGSELDGTRIFDGVPDKDISMSVIAIRRDDDWILAPETELTIQANDILIAKGTQRAAEVFRNYS